MSKLMRSTASRMMYNLQHMKKQRMHVLDLHHANSFMTIVGQVKGLEFVKGIPK